MGDATSNEIDPLSFASNVNLSAYLQDTPARARDAISENFEAVAQPSADAVVFAGAAAEFARANGRSWPTAAEAASRSVAEEWLRQRLSLSHETINNSRRRET